jgi:serine-type D-Ala-D-Ala carboxypeptidase/endopeptidase
VIADSDNLIPNDHADPYAHYTAEHLYEFLATRELTRTPGDTYEYSNLGAGLLGHALAVRAGNSDFESLVRDRILGPIGMNDTVIAIPHRLRDRVAVAHDDSLDPVPTWNLGALAGAGGFRSTVADLLLFLDARQRSDCRAHLVAGERNLEDGARTQQPHFLSFVRMPNPALNE